MQTIPATFLIILFNPKSSYGFASLQIGIYLTFLCAISSITSIQNIGDFFGVLGIFFGVWGFFTHPVMLIQSLSILVNLTTYANEFFKLRYFRRVILGYHFTIFYVFCCQQVAVVIFFVICFQATIFAIIKGIFWGFL